jgi:hypothetical protein
MNQKSFSSVSDIDCLVENAYTNLGLSIGIMLISVEKREIIFSRSMLGCAVDSNYVD